MSDADDGKDPFEATDEQMFKMDAMLASYFATMRSGRDSKRARQDMINFKLRALACLEGYMRKVPEGHLLLLMPAPLLSALVAVNKPGGDRVLAERIAAVLRNKLSKCKAEVTEEEDAEELKAQLRRALYLASRTDDAVVVDAAIATYIFLQRCLHESNRKDVQNVAEESATAALDDFFQKKRTRLGRPFFQQLFMRVPSVAVAALPTLLVSCASARNEFMQQEAFWLVSLAAKVSSKSFRHTKLLYVITMNLTYQHPPSLTFNVFSMQATDSEAVKVLTKSNTAVAAMVESALSGLFSKPARRTEAVKTVCSLAQTLSAKGSSLMEVLGAKLGKKISGLLDKAQEEHDKDANLARLATLMVGGGGVVQAGNGKAAAAGKRKEAPGPQVKKAAKKK